MMHEPSQMIRALKQGKKLTADELAFLRSNLQSPEDGADIYEMCRALALAVPASSSAVQLVEQYFEVTTDEWYMQGVIYALCSYWGLTDRYLDKLLWLTLLEQWKDYPSAALAAFSALGAYLNNHPNAEILAHLLAIYESDLTLYKAGNLQFEKEHIVAVYQAIDRAIRGKEAQLAAIGFKFPKDVNKDVLLRAVKLASKLRKKK
jgi:hypothetical protein